MTLVPVLMYHAVGRPLDVRFRRWSVSPQLLDEQLGLLKESGYELVGLTEWVSCRTKQKCVVLTFDDGYTDFIDNALPILMRHGARATLYVVTGYIGGHAQWLPFETERSRPIMGWNDLEAVQGCGIEIGSHGHQHIELDTVRRPAAERDVRLSREVLTSRGFSPQSFCYPFGYVTRRVRHVVAGAGFTTACMVGRGLADSDQDLLRIRRLAVDHRTAPGKLLRCFHGPAVPPSARVREAGQPVWRFARRVRAMAGTQ